MGPDPEKIPNGANFEHSDYIMNQMDDEIEMEVEEQQNDGYFRLNLDGANEYIPANDESSDDESGGGEDDDEEFNEFAIPESVQLQQQEEEADYAAPQSSLPSIATASSELVAEVWKSQPPPPAGGASNIELTSEKSHQITQIMSKISLPNAPNWLDELSTESVLDRIKQRRSAGDVGSDKK
jgi:hypothetical protein